MLSWCPPSPLLQTADVYQKRAYTFFWSPKSFQLSPRAISISPGLGGQWGLHLAAGVKYCIYFKYILLKKLLPEAVASSQPELSAEILSLGTPSGLRLRLVAQSCPTLCEPMDCSPPGSSVWSGLPFPSPGNLPDPGIEPGSPTLQADSLLTELPGKLSCLGPQLLWNIENVTGSWKITKVWEKRKSWGRTEWQGSSPTWGHSFKAGRGCCFN